MAASKAPAGHVLIKDEKADVNRKYKRHVQTRSRKRAVRAMIREIEKVREEVPDEATLEQEGAAEDAIMRLYCDWINELLEVGEKSPVPGDMLYEQWQEDLIPEEKIFEARDDASGAEEDPT